MAVIKKAEDLRTKLSEKRKTQEKKSASLKTTSDALRKLNAEISAIENELKYAELNEIVELMLERSLSFDDVKAAIKSGAIKSRAAADVSASDKSDKQGKITDTAESSKPSDDEETS